MPHEKIAGYHLNGAALLNIINMGGRQIGGWDQISLIILLDWSDNLRLLITAASFGSAASPDAP